MLSFPSSVRIYLCTRPADLRRSFDGLAALTQEVIGQNPLSGHWFVFRNRRGDRMKILVWDRTGYCVWYKRLEAGTFRFPAAAADSVEVEVSDLALILEGMDLVGVSRRKRYGLPVPVRVAE